MGDDAGADAAAGASAVSVTDAFWRLTEQIKEMQVVDSRAGLGASRSVGPRSPALGIGTGAATDTTVSRKKPAPAPSSRPVVLSPRDLQKTAVIRRSKPAPEPLDIAALPAPSRDEIEAMPVFAWSDEAATLRQQCIEAQRRAGLSSADRIALLRPQVMAAFRTLRLQKLGISVCDSAIAGFTSVTELSLTNNRLTEVQALPPNIRILRLNGNQLTAVPAICTQRPMLQQLTLSYNRIAALDSAVLSRLTALLSLDLGFNALTDLPATRDALAAAPRLRHLCLRGNPLALLPRVRQYMVVALPRLSYLDSVGEGSDAGEVTKEERAAPPPPSPLPDRVRLALWVDFLVGLRAPAAPPVATPDTKHVCVVQVALSVPGAAEPLLTPLCELGSALTALRGAALTVEVPTSLALRDALYYEGLPLRVLGGFVSRAVEPVAPVKGKAPPPAAKKPPAKGAETAAPPPDELVPIAPPVEIASACIKLPALVRATQSVSVADLCVAALLPTDAEPDALLAPPTAHVSVRALMNEPAAGAAPS